MFPELPTVGEFLRYQASVWFGIGAPRHTPDEIVDRLNKKVNAGLAHPLLNARLGELGGLPLSGTSAEFEKLFVGATPTSQFSAAACAPLCAKNSSRQVSANLTWSPPL